MRIESARLRNAPFANTRVANTRVATGRRTIGRGALGRRAAARFLTALIAAALTGLASSGRAEDVVLLKAPEGASGNARLLGEILDYDGRELRLRLTSGRERRVPAEQILSASVSLCAAHDDADASFATRDFSRALAQYRAALGPEGERRAWLRRRIIAQIIWCQRALGQAELAAQTFVQALVPSGVDGPEIDCIPLCWRPTQPTAGFERTAGEWIQNQKSPWTALVGASFLLGGRERPAAVERLKRLSAGGDPRVVWLAEAQLWRTTLATENEGRLVERLRSIENCPEPLRAGPYYLVGMALLKTRPDDAALALMQTAIIYPRERQLSAAALLAVGGMYQGRGRDADAARLYRELVDQYAGSPEAGAAASRLNAKPGPP